MRRFFTTITILTTIAISTCYSQSNVSKPMSFNIQKEVKPAILDIVPGSIKFIDQSGNNAIDANETCKIQFQLKNRGMGDGYGCIAKISAAGSTQGLSYKNKNLSTIKVGETVTVEIPISANMQTVDGNVLLSLQVDEPNGFGTDPMQMNITTKKFVSPMLKVVDYRVTSERGSSVLAKKEVFDLQVLLQNTEYGTANNIKAQIVLPEGVTLIGGEGMKTFDTMNAGNVKSLDYSLIVTTSYTSSEIPIQIKVSEKYGKYSENKTITLKLNQTLASTKISVDAIEDNKAAIKMASLGSDVDKNIPETGIKNEKAYAVIIANEHYSDVASVPYAVNDGKVFSEYCKKTLGLTDKHIHLVTDATKNQIMREIDWLNAAIDARDGDINIIFYYAGHGIPDEASKSAYLLPVDGYGTNVNTAYKLDDLYKTLGQDRCNSVTVLLDACFSGAKREGDMLASARGVAIKVKSGQPIGNMVVFSAAAGDQTAGAYDEQEHGRFTYFLLKKLQETRGDVTYKELSDYISSKVKILSSDEGKLQTPTVIPSSSIESVWMNWKLK